MTDVTLPYWIVLLIGLAPPTTAVVVQLIYVRHEKGKEEREARRRYREKETQPILNMLNDLTAACRYSQMAELVNKGLPLQGTWSFENLKTKALEYWTRANEVIPRIAHEPLRKLADEISTAIILRTPINLATEPAKELEDMIRSWTEIENDIRQAQLELENYVSTIPSQP